jgi:hypothetical protein
LSSADAFLEQISSFFLFITLDGRIPAVFVFSNIKLMQLGGAANTSTTNKNI